MPTELIREKTYRRIKPLAEELGISRKRLDRFLKGELDCKDLTVREQQALSSHPIFEELMLDLGVVPSPEKEKTDKPSFEVKLTVEFDTNGSVILRTEEGEPEDIVHQKVFGVT